MTEHGRIRIDDGVVIRPSAPWTPTIHALLRHLGARRVPVPEPLSFDADIERLSLVVGTSGDDTDLDGVSPDGARSIGRLLRRVHDASRSFHAGQDATWSVPHGGGPVICHGDPKPANMAWIDGEAVGIFDWDAARPGQPEEDLAYALLWTVPIEAMPRGDAPGPEENGRRRSRAEALIEGYGWAGGVDVVDWAVRRQSLAIDEAEHLGMAGVEPQATWREEGWIDVWRRALPDMYSAGRAVFPQGPDGP